MGEQKDKILEQLSKRKWLAPKEDYKTLLKYFGGKAKMKKTLANWKKNKPPFKHFHKSWSKQRVLDVWKGDTWEQIIDFCELAKIKPKEIMNWAAGKKIDHTHWKTMGIAKLCREKLEEESKKKKPRKPRSVILGLSSQLSDIDDNLETASDDKIYKTCWNAMKRTGR